MSSKTMTHDEAVAAQDELSKKAENLKEDIWGFLDDVKCKSPEVREAMNSLLDEIESIEWEQ